VYKCPHCDFVERPRVPRKSHKKNDPPRPAQKKCITHKVTPELISCECIIKTQEVSTGWIVSCQGIHQHPRPPPITLNQDAYNEFAKWVKVGPGIKPKNLTVGNHTREGVGAAIHPALYNLDRTRYLRNKVLAGSSLPSSLDGIIAWAKRVDFIQSSSLGGKDGHICMQNKGMLKLLSEMASPMQTDSVHGFVYYHSDALPQSFLYESKDPALRSKADYSNEEINITFTSIFDDVLGRTVPVLVSLLFGKTADHYKVHFLQLFESLEVSTFEEFEAVSALTILRDPELASQLTNQDESEFEETVESCREVLHQPWRKQQQPVTDTAIQERLDKLAGRKNTRIAKTNTKKKPNSKVQQNLLSTFQPVTLSKKHPTTQQGSLTRQKKHQSPAVQKVAPKTSQEMHSPSVEHTHHTRSRSRLSLPKNRRSPQETKHTTRSGRKITRKRDRDSAFDFSTSARKKT